MKARLAVWATAFTALAGAGTLQAHHAGAMYESKPVWFHGTVVQFDHINPHTITTLEERSADGKVRYWAVEGPAEFQLERLGIDEFPQIGQVITVCAFPYKSRTELSRLFPDADFSASRAIHDADDSSPQCVAGHVMIMRDGEKRLWEPHGVLSECIRSSDEPVESWLGFLNSDSRAHDAWCEQRKYALIREDASLSEFVETINNAIDNPC